MTGTLKSQVIEEILRQKIIVIVRGVAARDLIPMAEAMYDGGIRLLEITYSATGTPSAEETAEDIRMLTEHFGDRMCFGAGTVLNEEQVALTAAAGGKFIISPDTNPGVIRKTAELGLVSIPGALTPTEAQTAHRAGANFVKLFPVSDLGPDYVKAIRAPLSHIRFLAVGGITLDNIPSYLGAGVCGFGIGSAVADRKKIAAGDFDGIRKIAEAFAAAVAKA